MGAFLVVRCPRCGNARVAQATNATTACGHCLNRIDLRKSRVHHRTDDLEEAQRAAGLVNARVAGRQDEFVAAFVPAKASVQKHESRADAAAARARGVESEPARAEAVARALTEFDLDEFSQALDLAGVPPQRAEAHVARLVAQRVLFEPRPGRYRLI